MMGAHSNDRVSMRWWIGEKFVVAVGDDGAEEGAGGQSLFMIGISVPSVRTTIHGFRALLSIGLGVRVTTGRVATHCARGSRFACSHSTLCGTSARLSLFPLA